MPVPLQDDRLDGGLLIIGQVTLIDSPVQSELCNVLQVVGSHIHAQDAIVEEASQLKKGMKCQGSHMRLRPTIPTNLNILLELDPSVYK